MAQRSRPEPVQSGAFHLEHRYMYGLRFDGLWSYLARNSAGAWRWKALPLPEASSARVRLGDPQGAWWCARQCAAVMNPSALPPQSLVKAQVLLAGGCALLRLESLDRKAERNGNAASVRWAWMVGMETWHQTRADRPMQGSIDSTGTDSTVHALLVVGPHWPALWGSCFGAKVRAQTGGSWRLASTDGEVMHCKVTACIAIQPAGPMTRD